MAQELLEVQKQRDDLVAELQIGKLKSQIKLVKQLNENIDSWHDIPATGYELSNRDEPLFGGIYPPVPRPYTSLSDRNEGRFLPYYEHEYDLRRMRARARSLHAFTTTAIAAMSSLNHYVIGSGLTLETTPTNDGIAGMAVLAKEILDETYDRNDMYGSLDGEIHDCSRTDGDALVLLYENDDRTIDIELNDPETLRRPDSPRPLENFLKVGHKLNEWWFGVHTQYANRKKHMDWRPLGYHFVYDETGDQWDYVPAARVEHFKRNVPRNAPRGISDYVPVDTDLHNEVKLRMNTVVGAAIQASIAYIRQHAPGVTKDQVMNMLGDNSVVNFQRDANNNAEQVQVEKFHPGKIADIDAGLTYHAGPMGQLRSPIFIEVSGYVLRSIGMRWKFPEYMISGDASNANFASTMVAESPFVKAREADQGFYKRGFRSLSWKILMLAYKLGRFPKGWTWSEIQNSVEIACELPEVASRDALKNAQANALLHDKKLLSLQTWSQRAELDFETEQGNRATEPEPTPVSMPGAPVRDPQPKQTVAEQIRIASEKLWEAYP